MIITLVHGTWARGAPWTDDKSAIRQTIQKQFADVHFEQFLWSGGNSHRARSRAAAELQKHLLDCEARYPGQDHFLIAHSHGGNVALYALRDDRMVRCVRGVICLSTPFLHCRRRNLGPLGLVPVLVCIGLCSLLMFGAQVRIWWPTLSLQATALIATILFTTVSVCLASYCGSLLHRFFGVTSASELSAKVETSFSLPNLDSEMVFAVRAPGDEASGALTTSHFLSFLLTRVSRFINLLADAGEWIATSEGAAIFERWFRRVAFCALGLISVLVIFRTGGTALAGQIEGIVLKIVLLPILGFLAWALWAVRLEAIGLYIISAAGAILIPFLLLLAIIAAPFGLDTALLAPKFEITAEATPPGRVTLFELTDATTEGLWHSSPYASEAAFKEILAWMTRRLKPASINE